MKLLESSLLYTVLRAVGAGALGSSPLGSARLLLLMLTNHLQQISQEHRIQNQSRSHIASSFSPHSFVSLALRRRSREHQLANFCCSLGCLGESFSVGLQEKDREGGPLSRLPETSTTEPQLSGDHLDRWLLLLPLEAFLRELARRNIL